MSSASNEPTLEQIRTTIRSFDVEQPSSRQGRLDLQLDECTGIATLCINSPARKNAWSGSMMAQFSDALSTLEQWKEGRAVVIYGADGFFCSGADLKTVQRSMELQQTKASLNSTNSSNTSSSFTASGAYYIATLMHDNFRRLEALPLVSVALVEGKAIGGGAEVVASTDLRVFTADAQIGFVHGRLGLTPGFGGGCRLVRLLGPTRALQMMLSAKPVSVSVAQELGLVEHVLEEGIGGKKALEATISWYLAHYGSISAHASRHLKSIVGKVAGSSSLTEALQFEAGVFQAVWGSEEHRASLANNIKHN